MNERAELGCKDLVELITDYLEDAVPADERARLDEHLMECDGCGRYLEQIRTTIRVAGTLTEEAISPQAREALLGVFRVWKAETG